MGATRGSILRIFSMTGFAIGLAGTAAGLVLGLLVAVNVEAIRSTISDLLNVSIFPPELFLMAGLPSRVDPGEVTTVVLLSLRPDLPRVALSGVAGSTPRSDRRPAPMSAPPPATDPARSRASSSSSPGATCGPPPRPLRLGDRRADADRHCARRRCAHRRHLGDQRTASTPRSSPSCSASTAASPAYPIEAQFTDYGAVGPEIEGVDGVVAAIPFVEGQALASGAKADATEVILRGVSLGSVTKLKLLHDGAILGHWDGWDDGNGVAIGRRLAEKLKVNIGEMVTLLTPEPEGAQGGSRPRTRSYPVQVIFDLGMTEFDSFYLYMPLQPAQDYLDMFDRVLKPGVSVPALDAPEEERRRPTTASIAPPRSKCSSPTRAPSTPCGSLWAAVRATADPLGLAPAASEFLRRAATQGSVMFVILSMIIVVAAFDVVSSLIMLVKDKGTDIAVLRTMGATRGSIMRIFGIAGVRGHRSGRHADRACARAAHRRQCRGDPGVPLKRARLHYLPARSVLPLLAPQPHQPVRGGDDRGGGDGAQFPCDALSRLARHRVRSGRGPALS